MEFPCHILLSPFPLVSNKLKYLLIKPDVPPAKLAVLIEISMDYHHSRNLHVARMLEKKFPLKFPVDESFCIKSMLKMRHQK